MTLPITKRWSEHMEELDGESTLVLVVTIFHGTQETILHLCWQIFPGRPTTFASLSVNCFYMNILNETPLVKALASFTHETTVQECRHVLRQLGFTLMPSPKEKYLCFMMSMPSFPRPRYLMG